MAAKGTIYGINGPIVYIAGDSGFQMNEMVYVGEANLVGEVIGLTSERTTIEVYEETTGLKPGESVTGTGAPVSVTLSSTASSYSVSFISAACVGIVVNVRRTAIARLSTRFFILNLLSFRSFLYTHL